MVTPGLRAWMCMPPVFNSLLEGTAPLPLDVNQRRSGQLRDIEALHDVLAKATICTKVIVNSWGVFGE
jgi:hypothetical protein